MPDWLKEILDPTPVIMTIWMMCLGWQMTVTPAVIPEPIRVVNPYASKG